MYSIVVVMSPIGVQAPPALEATTTRPPIFKRKSSSWKGVGHGISIMNDLVLDVSVEQGWGHLFTGCGSEKSVLNQLLKQRDNHNDHLGQSNVQRNGTKCIANLTDKSNMTVIRYFCILLVKETWLSMVPWGNPPKISVSLSVKK